MNKIRFFLVTFSLAVLVSFVIFNLYNSQNAREDIALLNTEENNILNRCGVAKEKFRFSSYPESDFNSQVVTWDENESYSGSKSLKLTFKGNNTKHYVGIHFYLTLNLHPYLEKGILEFWIKGNKDPSLINNLNIYLKEGPIIQRMVKTSLPTDINENWQGISVPINSFHLVKKYDDINKEFTWEIQEVLFSINPLNSNQSAEFFIAELKILNDNQPIYELF